LTQNRRAEIFTKPFFFFETFLITLTYGNRSVTLIDRS